MAKKRMFDITIVENDVFLDMPSSSQNLYFHLCMNADDDGFVSPKKIMRMCSASEDDLQVLVAKRYLLLFESGVAVIKHWTVNNAIKKDRYIPTTHQEEFKSLTTNEWKVYTERRTIKVPLIDLQQSKMLNAIKSKNGSNLVPQYSIEESSIDKNSSYNGDKSPVSEISIKYYKVIKKLKLPVRNHNNVKAVIKKMEAENIDEENLEYLDFMLEGYFIWEHRYKPSITEALDIYNKRNMIIEKFNPTKSSRGVKL